MDKKKALKIWNTMFIVLLTTLLILITSVIIGNIKNSRLEDTLREKLKNQVLNFEGEDPRTFGHVHPIDVFVDGPYQIVTITGDIYVNLPEGCNDARFLYERDTLSISCAGGPYWTDQNLVTYDQIDETHANTYKFIPKGIDSIEHEPVPNQ